MFATLFCFKFSLNNVGDCNYSSIRIIFVFLNSMPIRPYVCLKSVILQLSEVTFFLLFWVGEGKRGSKYRCKWMRYAIISPPAKRHLNGFSLADRWWPNIKCWLCSFVTFSEDPDQYCDVYFSLWFYSSANCNKYSITVFSYSTT